MDKYEYKVRADEIKELISRCEYAQAAEIADTIDWRRVKSVMMLCTISDLYKINRRYEDARDMLLLAYERRPGGRTICYSLCELSIKTEDFVEAVEYYKEFVQAAPKDPGRFILQYKLYEAQDVSLEERIAVLEELKKRDYREKWAYELAYLYHRIGLAARCVEECDELILWFGEGKYVIKAMELKMLHEPLTPSQQQKYDHRYDAPAAYRQAVETGSAEQSMEQQSGSVPANMEAGSQDYSVAPGENAVTAQDGGWEQTAIYEAVGEFAGAESNAEEVSYGQEYAYAAESMAGSMEQNVALDNMTEEQAVQDGAAGETVEQQTSSEAEEELDIHVKTMDMGQYNTINLQAELAAGLREVLAEEQKNPIQDSITRAIVAPMFEDTETLDYPEIDEVSEDDLEPVAEEIESTEVFFGETGEIGDVPPIPKTVPDITAEIVMEQLRQENVMPEAQPVDEAEAVTDYAADPGIDEVLAHAAGAAVIAEGMEVYTEEAAPKIVHAEPPRELAHVLSQEADGQLSLVMPESEQIEKQITGQMNIEDILAEWERMKKEQQEKREEEVRQHVLQQTGNMFTEFEAAVRDGLLEQLEREKDAKAAEEKAVAEEYAVAAEEYANGAEEYAVAAEEYANDAEEYAVAEAEYTNDVEEYAVTTEEYAGATEEETFFVESAETDDGLGEVEELEEVEQIFGDELEDAAYAEEQFVGVEMAEEFAEVEQSVATESFGEEEVFTEIEEFEAFEEPVEAETVEEIEELEEPVEAEMAEETEELEEIEEVAQSEEYVEAEQSAEAEVLEETEDFTEVVELEEIVEAEAVEEIEEPEETVEAEAVGEIEELEEAVEAETVEEIEEPEEAVEAETVEETKELEEIGEVAQPEEAVEGEAVAEAEVFEQPAVMDEATMAEELKTMVDQLPVTEVVQKQPVDPAYEATMEELRAAASGFEEAMVKLQPMQNQDTQIYEPVNRQEVQTPSETNASESKFSQEQQTSVETVEQGSQPAAKKEVPQVEREKAKVRALTREEKELYAPFIQSRAAREQLVRAIDNITLASYTGNVIITGEEGMDTLTLAKNMIRELQATDSNFSGKVAKISGSALNSKDVAATIGQQKNGALIISKATDMNNETVDIMYKVLQQEHQGIVVILVDARKPMDKFLTKYEQLKELFTARMDVEALSNDTLVAFGRRYARELEYSIDELGMLALHTRIAERQTIDHVVTVIEVKEIVDKAIRRANKKTLGHFFDILFAKRYDEEDMIVLSEKDFA